MPTARSVRRPLEIQSKSSNISSPAKSLPKSEGTGLFSTVAEGFAFGVGSSVARHTVDRVFGMGSKESTSTNSEYEKCLKDNWNDAYFCAHLKKDDE